MRITIPNREYAPGYMRIDGKEWFLGYALVNAYGLLTNGHTYKSMLDRMVADDELDTMKIAGFRVYSPTVDMLSKVSMSSQPYLKARRFTDDIPFECLTFNVSSDLSEFRIESATCVNRLSKGDVELIKNELNIWPKGGIPKHWMTQSAYQAITGIKARSSLYRAHESGRLYLLNIFGKNLWGIPEIKESDLA